MSSIADTSVAVTNQPVPSVYTLGEGIFRVSNDGPKKYVEYHESSDKPASLRLSQGPMYHGSTVIETDVDPPMLGSGITTMAESSSVLDRVQTAINEAEGTAGSSMSSEWEDVKAIVQAAKPAMDRAVEKEKADRERLNWMIEQIAELYASDKKKIEFQDHHTSLYNSMVNKLTPNLASGPILSNPGLVYRAAAAIAAVVTSPKDKAWISGSLQRQQIVQRLAVLTPGTEVEPEPELGGE
jgi:hypothetical protein